MELCLLNRENVKTIYDSHMVRDFPDDELKPWAAINTLYDKGIYQCYGLYDGGQLLAYACFTGQAGGTWLLLDYYAVCSGYRERGYGSKFLNALWQTLQNVRGIFVEIELVDCAADEEDRCTRERRRNFYLRGGLRATAIRNRLFGVDYEVLLMPCAGQELDEELSDRELLAEMTRIYQTIMPDKAFADFVELTLAE